MTKNTVPVTRPAVGVVDDVDRARHRHGGAGEGGDHPVLAPHVVRAREHVPERRAAHDERRAGSVDGVREVAPAAGDDGCLHRPVHELGVRLGQPRGRAPRHPVREPRSSSTLSPPRPRDSERQHTGWSVCCGPARSRSSALSDRRGRRPSIAERMDAGTGVGRRVAASTKTCTKRPVAIGCVFAGTQDAERPGDARRAEALDADADLERLGEALPRRGTRTTTPRTARSRRRRRVEAALADHDRRSPRCPSPRSRRCC